MIKLRIGAGYQCHKCKHEEQKQEWERSDCPKKCNSCGSKQLFTYEIGMKDHIVFIFTYNTRVRVIKWKDRNPEKRQEGVWKLHSAWEDDCEEAWEDIKKKDAIVKIICSWSVFSGIYLARIHGLNVTGFPFGFSLEHILSKTHLAIQYLPDHIQVIHQIERFIQRYFNGLAKLEDE